jgi:PAS domain S-box-containing protein
MSHPSSPPANHPADAILEVALDAIVSMDHQGLITQFNPAAERMFGYTRAEAVGSSLADLLVPASLRDAHRLGLQRYLRTGQGHLIGRRIELTATRSDGTEFPVEVAICRIPLSEPAAFTGFIRDLTEQRNSAEALRRVEARSRDEIERHLAREQAARAAAEDAVRVRDDFVATAGHELKTPLAALLLHVQSMQRSLKAGRPVDVTDRVEKLARSGLRLERLVNQLLDVARIAGGRLGLEPEPLELGALVREVATRFADEIAGAKPLISVHGDDEVNGCWDRLRIDQVLTNLLSNALKYGEGKPVEISFARDEADAVVRVIDHGIGIEEEHQKRIFSRFERAVSPRVYGGFGLGLWIARRIVEASGGTIDVASELGRGSAFVFRLPIQGEVHARAAP